MQGTSDRLHVIPGTDYALRIHYGKRAIYTYDWNGKQGSVVDMAKYHSMIKEEEKSKSGELFSPFEYTPPVLKYYLFIPEN